MSDFNWRSRCGVRVVAALMAVAALLPMTGCEVDSFLFDRSKTGSFSRTPTMIPILERIDSIEQADTSWGATTDVTPDDLIPSDLSYRLYPGDAVTVSVFELYEPGTWNRVTRRIDAGGRLRVQELGDIPAAGLSPQELQDMLVQLFNEKVLVNPQVDVSVEQATSLRYTVYGFLEEPGVFTLNTPDLKLLDALAIAGGAPSTTEHIYVVRSIPLSDVMQPFDTTPRPEGGARPADTQPVDLQKLIEQLNNQDSEEEPAKPGAMREQDDDRPAPPVDVDDMEPVRDPQEPAIDVETLNPESSRTAPQTGEETWVYVPERGEWVKMKSGPGVPQQPGADASTLPTRQMVVERIIEIDYQRLQRGDSSLNIVIRPSDQIWVESPEIGNVYIDGEISRPGVYNLPVSGKLTLSRLVSAAGGLGPIAVPERVELTRRVGRNREAKVRLNLAAIRKGTEPDIIMKADDHVMIGTDFLATPLAIIRNGFRATYGFGFLLDRNFADDVFGESNDINN